MDKDLEASAAFKNNKFNFTMELNEGILHDNVTSGIEGGVQYWARVDVGKHELGWRNYFTATFHDHAGAEEVFEGGVRKIKMKKYKLSLAKLKKGLLILQQKYPHHFADIMRESGDATTGDVLIQCALLGEIVYG